MSCVFLAAPGTEACDAVRRRVWALVEGLAGAAMCPYLNVRPIRSDAWAACIVSTTRRECVLSGFWVNYSQDGGPS